MKNVSCQTENWFVSPYNSVDAVKKKLTLPGSVEFHDITLRDGEQQAGVVFRKDEKLKIAQLLDETGVPRIEAGMPAVSKEDREAVRAIAREGLNAKIFAFARCVKGDVDNALDCDVDGVIMEIPSSDHLLNFAYGWTVDKAIDLSVEATSYAAEHGLHVAFFTIDSTRAEFDSFWSIIDSVAKEGHMDSYVLVDTFGVCSPQAIEFLVREVKKRIGKAVEVHCHNDFGLAVINSIFGILGGADIVHTTVNGIGERSGSAALEEVAAALQILYGIQTNLNFQKFRELSKLVEKASRVSMPSHKPVVGDKIFTTESGIIAGWWDRASQLGKPLEVFPFNPKYLGFDGVEIALGKGSGKASIIYKLRELDLEVPSNEEIEEILMNVKTRSEEKKRLLTEKEFMAILAKISK